MLSMGIDLTGNIRLTSHLKVPSATGPKTGHPTVGANAESPESWLDRESYSPVARLYQSDDLRYGRRHAVFQRQL